MALPLILVGGAILAAAAAVKAAAGPPVRTSPHTTLPAPMWASMPSMPVAVSKLKRGCVVYRGLGPVEHSGIYIGGGEVVSLDGDGDVVSEGLDEFRAVEGQSIYVSCFDGEAVGDEEVADRAEDMVGSSRSYNLILDNCHQFASGCMTGDFENSDNFLWMLKDTASKELGAEEPWGIFQED